MTNLMLYIPTLERSGGAQRVFLNLIRNLDPKKYKISLVLNGVKGYALPDVPSHIKIIRLRSKKSRFAVFEFFRLVLVFKPDLVLSTMGYLNLLIAAFRPILPKKTVFLARETNTASIKNKYQKYPRIFDLMYRHFYNNLDGIIAQSQHMKDDLVRSFNVSSQKIFVIYNPVDTSYIDQMLIGVPSSSSRRKPYLVAVGRLNYQKGYDLLLSAVGLLDFDFRLELFGTGHELDSLKSLRSELGLEDSVIFCGHTDNPFMHMKTADLVLLSSRYEGLPNVVIEANYCGTPVVAFDSPGGTGEIIESGINGLLAVPCDYRDFADKIVQGLSSQFNPSEIKNLTADRFSEQKIVNQYQNLIDNICSKNK